MRPHGPAAQRDRVAPGCYLGDGAVAVAAWYGAVLLRVYVGLPFTLGLLPPDRLGLVLPVTVLVVALQLLTLYFLGFYDSVEPRPRLQVLSRLGGAALLQGTTLVAYLFLADRTFPRSVLVLYLLLDWAGLAAWRLAVQRTFRPPRRRVALVGASPAARELAAKIRLHGWHGLEVAGHVHTPEDPPPGTAEDEALGECLGTLDEIPAGLAAERFDDLVMVAATGTWQTRLVDLLAASRPEHTSLLLLPGPFESLIGRMRYRWVSDVPLVEVIGAGDWQHPPAAQARPRPRRRLVPAPARAPRSSPPARSPCGSARRARCSTARSASARVSGRSPCSSCAP